MPSNADTVPNLSKDWQYRGLSRPSRPQSKVYRWAGGQPRDAVWFALLFAGVLLVGAAMWFFAIFLLQVLAGL